MDKQFTRADRIRLAERLGLNEQYLYQCLTGRREMDPVEARRVEDETKGELTRRHVCTKTYALIWPELAKTRKARKEVTHG